MTFKLNPNQSSSYHLSRVKHSIPNLQLNQLPKKSSQNDNYPNPKSKLSLLNKNLHTQVAKTVLFKKKMPDQPKKN